MLQITTIETKKKKVENTQTNSSKRILSSDLDFKEELVTPPNFIFDNLSDSSTES